MTTYQRTGPAQSTTIRWGSCDLYIGDDEASAYAVGILDGDVTIQIEETPRRYKPANAPEQNDGMAEQVAIVTFGMTEQNFFVLDQIRKDLDGFSVTSTDAVTVTAEAHTVSGTEPVFLDYYTPATTPTIVGSIVVKDGSGDVIDLSGNYQVGVDARGYSFVLPLTGGSISDGDAITVGYAYTPASAFIWGTGGNSTISSRYMKAVNTDENGNDLKFEIWAATHDGGLTFTLGQDSEDAPKSLQIKMRCVFDATKAAGYQLLQITDEQGVTSQV